MSSPQPQVPASPYCGDCCTRLEQVGVTLGGNRVLHDINLHIHCGQLAAIIGPNGAGKTTLLRTLLGEIPCSGVIRFRPADGRPAASFRIGYVPQRLEFDSSSPVSVLDLFGASLSSRPLWTGTSARVLHQADEALRSVHAQSLIRQKIGTLSGGQLQRVLLALALTPIPDLLLLDEPVSGVDPAGIDLFYRMVSDLRLRHHLAIVMISHDIITTARFADRMLFLNRTIICAGTPQETLSHPAVISTFGRFEIPQLAMPDGGSIRDCSFCTVAL